VFRHLPESDHLDDVAAAIAEEVTLLNLLTKMYL